MAVLSDTRSSTIYPAVIATQCHGLVLSEALSRMESEGCEYNLGGQAEFTRK